MNLPVPFAPWGLVNFCLKILCQFTVMFRSFFCSSTFWFVSSVLPFWRFVLRVHITNCYIYFFLFVRACTSSFQYAGAEGRRHRLGEVMLFFDQPSYYDSPGLLPLQVEVTYSIDRCKSAYDCSLPLLFVHVQLNEVMKMKFLLDCLLG